MKRIDYSHIEDRLPAALDLAEPDDQVLARIKQRVEKGIILLESRKIKSTNWHRAWLPLSIAVMIGMIILAAGRQNVLAQIVNLFGYFPGRGFVNPSEVQVLEKPVTQKSQDNQFTLTKALREDTKVFLWGQFDQYFEDPGEVYLKLENAKLIPGTWRVFPNEADSKGLEIVFTDIPGDLQVDRFISENGWNIPVKFVSGETSDDIQPVSEQNEAEACQAFLGLDFCILGAKTNEGLTHVLVQINPQENSNQLRIFDYSFYTESHEINLEKAVSLRSPADVLLEFDSIQSMLANKYLQDGRPQFDLIFHNENEIEGNFRFRIDAVRLQVPVSAKTKISLGADPSIGENWPLDMAIEAAGETIRFERAYIAPEGKEGTFILESEPLRLDQERTLLMLQGYTNNTKLGTYGNRIQDGRYQFFIPFDDQPFGKPTGDLEISFDTAEIFVLPKLEYSIKIDKAQQTLVTGATQEAEGFTGFENPERPSMTAFLYNGIPISVDKLLFSKIEGENSGLYQVRLEEGATANRVATLPGKVIKAFRSKTDGAFYYVTGRVDELGGPDKAYQVYRWEFSADQPEILFESFSIGTSWQSISFSFDGQAMTYTSFTEIPGKGGWSEAHLVVFGNCGDLSCSTETVLGADYQDTKFYTTELAWSPSELKAFVLGITYTTGGADEFDLYTLTLQDGINSKLKRLSSGVENPIYYASWAAKPGKIYIFPDSEDNSYSLEEIDFETGKINRLVDQLPWGMREVLAVSEDQLIDKWSVPEKGQHALVIREYEISTQTSSDIWRVDSPVKTDVINKGLYLPAEALLIYRKYPDEIVTIERNTGKELELPICRTDSGQGYCEIIPPLN